MKFLKDTKITIGVAMAVIMQASGVIWYIAQLDSNLTSLQTTIQVQAGQINTLNVQMSQLSKDFNLSLNSSLIVCGLASSCLLYTSPSPRDS